MSRLASVVILVAASAVHAAPAVSSENQLLELIPDGSVAALVLRRGGVAWPRAYLDHNAALKRDLSEYLTRVVGADLSDVTGVALFARQLTPQPTWAVIITLAKPPGVLHGTPKGDEGGVPVVLLKHGEAAASLPVAVVVGNEAEVRSVVAVYQRRASALQSQTELGFFLSAARASDLAIGVNLERGLDPSMAQQLTSSGARQGLLTLSPAGLLQLEVLGEGSKLKGVVSLAELAIGAQLASLDQDRQKAMQSDDVDKALAAIVAHRSAEQLWAEVRPSVVGDRLVSRYQLPELKGSAMLLPILGAAAALAVPTFKKYMQRARNTEAEVQLRQLQSGVEGWYELGRGRAKGKGPAFPAATGWSPPRSCCAGGSESCSVGPEDFRAPAWKAFGFRPEGKTRFAYRFVPSGKGKAARFFVEAKGDPACDGNTVMMSFSGSINPAGDLELSPVHDGAANEN